jgi:hypothetical protein
MWWLLLLVEARQFVPDEAEAAQTYQSFTETGFPDFQVSNGPMLRARLPFALKELKYDHAEYKPVKEPAGSHSQTWLKLSAVIFAVWVGMQMLLRNKPPPMSAEDVAVARGWFMLPQVLAQLEMRVEAAQGDRNALAEIETSIHRFEEVLDSINLHELVTAKVSTLEAAKETRTAMLQHCGEILDRIDSMFKPPAEGIELAAA